MQDFRHMQAATKVKIIATKKKDWQYEQELKEFKKAQKDKRKNRKTKTTRWKEDD